jgi:hypothetical protein
MLSEVLSALKDLKSELQERLAQQPEYRALLILDRATSQLNDVLAPGREGSLASSENPPAAKPLATPPAPTAAGRLAIVRNAAPYIAHANTPANGAEPSAHAAPRALWPVMDSPPPSPAAGGAVVPPFRPPDAMPEPLQEDLDGPLPPTVIANEPERVAPSTIADFLIIAPPNSAQDSVAETAAAPAPVVAANDVADSAAPPPTEAISGMAVLYKSAGELPDAAPYEDGAAATPTPIAPERAEYEATAPNLAMLEDRPATPTATSSGLTAALYESTGDAPDLEPEDRVAFAPVRPAVAEDQTEPAVDAFEQTLAEAAKITPPPAKPPAPRSYLPILAAQRLAQSRKS